MTDILLTDDNELIFSDDGDLSVDVSEGQHVRLILETSKGDWTQTPLRGVGLIRYLKGKLDARLERDIRLQLAADGIAATVAIDGEEINVATKN